MSLTPGNTPRRVLDRVSELVPMHAGFRVLDLGSGCGDALAYWALQHHIDGVGIELLPVRAECGRRLMKWFGVSVKILEADLSSAQWPDTDLIYCVATCFDSAMRRQIGVRLSGLRHGTVVALIGMGLPKGYDLVHHEPVRFAWGTPELRIGRRVSGHATLSP